MKVTLATFNAKYIHTSLALRWLYVANKDRFDLSFIEFTIKESIEQAASDILNTECDVVGVSVSIWNVRHTAELVALLKQRKPELIIIAGGPEVTYEPEFFLTNWAIDYVISGEGEFVLGDLLEAIAEKEMPHIDGVSYAGHISRHVLQADLVRLAALPSPYQLADDVADLNNRLVYFETSRGCPYQCQYCLSSLEKGVRYFPEQYITDNLGYLIKQGARQIKFLDRTFNLHVKHTYRVFDFLLNHHRPGLSCQFEIYADLLTDETIDYLNTHLPQDYFRFEIGIQSTYEPTNVAVKRRQDFPLLAHNIRKLTEGGKIDFHLDLIAGLPYETFDRFARSFNDVFHLEAKEVQLGFLKMLRGTHLRNMADFYGYEYDAEAPYEVIANRDISEEELNRIRDAEHAVDKFWNSGRFTSTMDYLIHGPYAGRYFELFDEIGQFQQEVGFPQRGYLLEELFRFFHRFLQSRGLDVFDKLRKDYYTNFSRRPKGFWEDGLDKKKRKQLLYTIAQDRDFLQKQGLERRIIEKYTAIDPIDETTYLLTVFLQEEPARRLEINYTF